MAFGSQREFGHRFSGRKVPRFCAGGRRRVHKSYGATVCGVVGVGPVAGDGVGVCPRALRRVSADVVEAVGAACGGVGGEVRRQAPDVRRGLLPELFNFAFR